MKPGEIGMLTILWLILGIYAGLSINQVNYNVNNYNNKAFKIIQQSEHWEEESLKLHRVIDRKENCK